MLLELRVENLLLIEHAEIELVPGLNVVTGETGAGKTMLAHALDLLMGGKPRSGIVRPGADEAWVEGRFSVDPAAAWLPEEVAERVDEGELVLARRVTPEGRSRAYVGGRSATAGDLRDLGVALLAFHGQHAARRLLSPAAQLDLLDAACGPEQADRRRAHAEALAHERACERRRAELEEAAGARERELDLLRFELAEIDEVAPVEGEREELEASRDRLRHVEALRAASHGAATALGVDEGAAGVALAAAEAALEAVTGVDAALDALTERVRSLRIEADDVAGELARHHESIEADPQELERAEERLVALGRLERKHGGTVEAVLAHAEQCRTRLSELEDLDGSLASAAADLAEAAEARAQVAAGLRDARTAAAGPLARGVEERLAALAMTGATVEVVLEPHAPTPTGEDRCELLLAPNPGVPAAPVRDSASGGELSRVMLALLTVVGDARMPAGADGVPAERPVQVFDEIDAGVGGQTGRAVGEQLRVLARAGQVLCITHLPQIAALADRHFAIEKDTDAEPARTVVRRLDGTDVTGELVRMLGGETGDEGALRHAEELRGAA